MLEDGTARHGEYVTSFQACFRTRLRKKLVVVCKQNQAYGDRSMSAGPEIGETWES